MKKTIYMLLSILIAIGVFGLLYWFYAFAEHSPQSAAIIALCVSVAALAMSLYKAMRDFYG
jgi:flagellar basal body-associated protein FliL